MRLECNIFRNAYDQDCSNVVSIGSVLSGIKNGRWREQIEAIRNCTSKEDRQRLKNALPCATFSGIFEERLDDACVHYNQILVIDIDTITDKQLAILKPKLKELKWVLAYFNGPSKGIKILACVDSDLTKHRDHAFIRIEEFFNEHYGVKIDRSGKNVSRLCFVSYDPDLWINPSPFMLHVEDVEDSFAQFTRVYNSNNSFSAPENDASKVFERCVKMVRKSQTGGYHKGNRNNFVFTLSCLMCEFGVDPQQALMLIYERYNSLSFKEIQNTVSSAYKKLKHKFGTKLMSSRKSNQSEML